MFPPSIWCKLKSVLPVFCCFFFTPNFFFLRRHFPPRRKSVLLPWKVAFSWTIPMPDDDEILKDYFSQYSILNVPKHFLLARGNVAGIHAISRFRYAFQLTQNLVAMVPLFLCPNQLLALKIRCSLWKHQRNFFHFVHFAHMLRPSKNKSAYLCL